MPELGRKRKRAEQKSEAAMLRLLIYFAIIITFGSIIPVIAVLYVIYKSIPSLIPFLKTMWKEVKHINEKYKLVENLKLTLIYILHLIVAFFSRVWKEVKHINEKYKLVENLKLTLIYILRLIVTFFRRVWKEVKTNIDNNKPIENLALSIIFFCLVFLAVILFIILKFIIGRV